MKGILVEMFVCYLEGSVLSCVTEMEKEPKISLLQIGITYYWCLRKKFYSYDPSMAIRFARVAFWGTQKVEFLAQLIDST